jgi:hypothetical protein
MTFLKTERELNMRIEIEIGTKYKARNKRKDLCTVIDVLKTYNSKNELVKTMFLCEHEFMGQKMKHEENDTHIQLAVFENGKVEL